LFFLCRRSWTLLFKWRELKIIFFKIWNPSPSPVPLSPTPPLFKIFVM
jgi:hypothetical protein